MTITPLRRASDRARPEPRTAFRHFVSITTRWSDQDPYGHINNVAYYAWFDAAVNEHLVRTGALDIMRGDVIGLVVESQCTFLRPIAFPDRVVAAVKVGKLGTTSVRYRIAIFRDDETEASAQGSLVHAYVERASRRPVPLPAALRQALEPLG